MSLPPFSPIATATLAVTDASARVLLPVILASGQQRVVRLVNTGASPAFVVFGGATTDAVAGGNATASPDGGMPVLVGVVEVFTIFPGHTHMAAICQAGSTAILRVTVGEGE